MTRTAPARATSQNGRVTLALVACCLVIGLTALPAGAASTDGTATPCSTETDHGSAAGSPTDHVANVTLYRVTNATADGPESVVRLVENGTVEDADAITVGQTLVAVVESERFASALGSHDWTATERFLSALDGDADFRIVQTNPAPNQARMYAPVGPANATVTRNGSTVFVLVDTADLTFLRPAGDGTASRVTTLSGDVFAVVAGFGLGEPAWTFGTAGVPTVELSGPQSSTELRSLTEGATATPTGPPTETPTRMPTETPTGTSTTACTTGSSTTSTDQVGEPTVSSVRTAGPPSTSVGTTGTGGPGFTAVLALVAVVMATIGRQLQT